MGRECGYLVDEYFVGGFDTREAALEYAYNNRDDADDTEFEVGRVVKPKRSEFFRIDLEEVLQTMQESTSDYEEFPEELVEGYLTDVTEADAETLVNMFKNTLDIWANLRSIEIPFEKIIDVKTMRCNDEN